MEHNLYAPLLGELEPVDRGSHFRKRLKRTKLFEIRFEWRCLGSHVRTIEKYMVTWQEFGYWFALLIVQLHFPFLSS